ncbi:MAG: L-seryl-tRNA(Sec) selenium transferase [Acidobacteria bacterium]|nr:L-seryl-tRNA(Sec) selenium transferase [Acidobacteriota bacterium]
MKFQDLPPVEALLVDLRAAWPQCPHALLRMEAQRAIASARERLRLGEAVPPIAEEANRAIRRLVEPSLRTVINATGVILHTNLGRAPLPEITLPGGYCNLEYDLAEGRRGKRDAHVSGLLRALLGAETIVVNNNAAAVYLVVNALAAGGEVIVSRGELIEIGDGFRIPDILRAAGVTLVEVGTTNRTRIDDYAGAITANTRMLLRVHPSNFHLKGFTGKPPLGELVALGKERGLPVYEDLGSGCLIDLRPFGIDEPRIEASLAAGVDIVSFSGDKLLGGTQAGFVCGSAELVQKARRHPMYRALRLDKLLIAALERMLRTLLLEDYDAVPALAMIRLPKAAVEARAQTVAASLPASLRAEVIDGESVAGGGSTPDQAIPTALIAIPGSATRRERALRKASTPVIARIDEDRVLLDLRTVDSRDDAALTALVAGNPGEPSGTP